MFVPTLVPGISQLYPNFMLANLNGESLQIIAFIVKTSSSLQIEAAAVPVAGENAVPHRPAGQGIAHMGTLIVGRVDPAIDIEQSDAPTSFEPDCSRFTRWNVAPRGHAYPLRCRIGHDNLPPR